MVGGLSLSMTESKYIARSYCPFCMKLYDRPFISFHMADIDR